MFANKILSQSRQLLRRSALPLSKVGESARNCHVVAVPPKNKVSNGELAVMFVALFGSLWTIPFWVLYHLPDYQKEDRNQYTGK